MNLMIKLEGVLAQVPIEKFSKSDKSTVKELITSVVERPFLHCFMKALSKLYTIYIYSELPKEVIIMHSALT